MNNPALSTLRNHTAALHQRLDQDSPLSMLTSRSCTYENYKNAMYGLALAYQEIDAVFMTAAEHCPPQLPCYQARLPFLSEDIINLGMTPPDDSVSSLSPPEDSASYLGMRYVIEGSSLGAKIINKELSCSVIAEDIETARCFWSVKNPQDPCWPKLLTELAGLQTRQEIERASSAAYQTFNHFICCLN